MPDNNNNDAGLFSDDGLGGTCVCHSSLAGAKKSLIAYAYENLRSVGKSLL
jgi:hypothetical protein